MDPPQQPQQPPVLRRRSTQHAQWRPGSRAVAHKAEEHYLRDDVRLPAAGPALAAPDAATPHWAVPTARAVLKYTAAFEGVADRGALLLLASVAREAGRLGGPKQALRVRALAGRAAAFDDLHSAACWRAVERAEVEAAEKTAFARTAAAVRWLAAQPGLAAAPPVLVRLPRAADDADAEDGLNGGGVAAPAYFAEYWAAAPALQELVDAVRAKEEAKAEEAAAADAAAASSASAPFRPHLPAARLRALVRAGRLVAGPVAFAADDETAFVEPAGGPRVLVAGRRARNRALPGDVVAVRLLPEAQWARYEERLAYEAEEGEEEEEDEAGDEDEAGGDAPGDAPAAASSSREKESPKVPTGEVVGIVARAKHEVVACLAEEDEAAIRRAPAETLGARRRVLCIPRDWAYPFVVVWTRRAGEVVGRQCVVRLDGWDRDSRSPAGHIVRVLGEVGTLQGNISAVLSQFDSERRAFSPAALSELPDAAWTPPPAEVAARRDLRAEAEEPGELFCICSIDPPGCTDVDDVLSVRFLSEAEAEVGVHIADVSHFVRAGQALDREARQRGTTTYLVETRHDMLPAVLSEHLCSLVAGEDRLAMSVVWTLDRRTLEPVKEADGRDRVWIGRTVIRSQHQLSYQQAQAVLDGREPPRTTTGPALGAAATERIRAGVGFLRAVARRLHKKRAAAGALELASAEIHFSCDARTGLPTAASAKKSLPVMGVVAELMIAANGAVARAVHAAFPTAALLRRHLPPPAGPGLERLQEVMGAKGVACRTDSNAGFAESIARYVARCEAEGDPAAAETLRAMATRAMAEAEYFATGDGAPMDHYGLALAHYTHFTSPIRRYADIVVHRQLTAALEGRPRPPVAHDLLGAVADGINVRHRAAKRAQQECSRLYLLHWFRDYPQREAAVVTRLFSNGFTVFLPKYHVTGPVHLVDRDGSVKWPEGAPEAAEGRPPTPAGAFAIELTATAIALTDRATGRTLLRYALMQHVRVEVSGTASRVRPPRLRLALLAAGAERGAEGGRAAAAVPATYAENVEEEPAAAAAGAGPEEPAAGVRWARPGAFAMVSAPSTVPALDPATRGAFRRLNACEALRARAWLNAAAGTSGAGSELGRRRRAVAARAAAAVEAARGGLVVGLD